MRMGQTLESLLKLSTYEVQEVRSIREIKEQFPEGSADENNWLFVGTGGFHGSHLKLDDLELILSGDHPDTMTDEDGRYWTTVLIMSIKPRQCVLGYGEIKVNKDDIVFLRKVCKSTLDSIYKSQEKNL